MKKAYFIAYLSIIVTTPVTMFLVDVFGHFGSNPITASTWWHERALGAILTGICVTITMIIFHQKMYHMD